MTIFASKPDIDKKGLPPQVVESRIFNMMLDLGIPANLKGFTYLSDAIRIAYYDPMLGAKVVEGIYKTIASEKSTTVQCVEHSIRTALKRVDSIRKQQVLLEFFGTQECPTPKKFIHDLADRLRISEKADTANRSPRQ